MAGQNQTRTIRIRVVTDDKALKAITGELNKLNRTTNSMAGTFSLAKRAFAAFAAVQGVQGLMNMSDNIQLLRDRIKVLSGSTEGATEVFNRLSDASKTTKMAVGDLANIYARMAASTKETGIRTKDLIKLTETLANSFRLSGATGAEATAVAVQLSQGFASGELRGQELRSVLEQNVLAGEILTKEFKVQRGELYKLAERGMLNATRVMKAFLNASEDINSQAAQLSQTFGQTLTLAMDKVSIKLEELNRKFQISDKFAKSVDVLIENFDNLFKILVAISGLKAVSWFAGLLGGLSKFPNIIAAVTVGIGKLINVITNLNPWVAGLKVIVLGTIIFWEELVELYNKYVVPAFDALGKVIKNFLGVLSKLPEMIEVAYLGIKSLFTGSTEEAEKATKSLNSYFSALNRVGPKRIPGPALPSPLATDVLAEGPLGSILDPIGSLIKSKKPMVGQYDYLKSKDKRSDEKLKEFELLNNAYRSGSMSLMEYANALDRVERSSSNAKFIEGSITEFERRSKLAEITTRELTRALNQGAISQANYSEAIDTIKLEQLNEQLLLGTMTLKDFNEEMLKLESRSNNLQGFTVGIQRYMDGLGTMAEQIAGATERAFGSLEDSMTEFIRTGQQDWKDFANGILDDITRIVIRAQIIKPLAGGIMDFFSPSLATSAPMGDIGGRAGSSFMTRELAKGGIVDKPTFMGFSGGAKAIAGEAGPEAVLPLTRSSNGDLGVSASVSPVNINIINNAGVEISQKETSGPDGSRTLDILINNKVSEGIARGSFDRVMNQTYGLKRRGS